MMIDRYTHTVRTDILHTLQWDGGGGGGGGGCNPAAPIFLPFFPHWNHAHSGEWETPQLPPILGEGEIPQLHPFHPL